KAIAATGDGLDAAAVCSPTVEEPAKRGDLDGQVAALDDSPRPHRVNDLVSGDEIPRPLEQETENFEGTRADRGGKKSATLITARKAEPVEAEPLEKEHVGSGERVHASASQASMSKTNGR